MQKLSIELEKGTKSVNISENINLESMKSKVKKRSLPVEKVGGLPDRKVSVDQSSEKIPLQKNFSWHIDKTHSFEFLHQKDFNKDVAI